MRYAPDLATKYARHPHLNPNYIGPLTARELAHRERFKAKRFDAAGNFVPRAVPLTAAPAGQTPTVFGPSPEPGDYGGGGVYGPSPNPADYGIVTTAAAQDNSKSIWLAVALVAAVLLIGRKG